MGLVWLYVYLFMQEFYIRHVDGSRVKDEDKERVIHWLKAAIERRVSEVNRHLT
jgi:hypothetical protein